MHESWIFSLLEFFTTKFSEVSMFNSFAIANLNNVI